MQAIRGFFNTVQYDSNLIDNSFASLMENVADKCRAPCRWIARTEPYILYENWICGALVRRKEPTNWKRVVTVVVGLILAVPGQVLGTFAMAAAYGLSKEIRLKHAISVRKLTRLEAIEIRDLIIARQASATKTEKCDPISCLLCSILCCLCVLSCK